MGLSCNCDFGDYDYFFESPKDFSEFKGKRRKRCCSCNVLIEIGADCGEFKIYEIDEYGYEVYTPSKFMCEECIGLFFALEDLGFCLPLGENMHELVREYNEDFR